MLANMGFGRLMWLMLLVFLVSGSCEEPATKQATPRYLHRQAESYRRHFPRPYQQNYQRNRSARQLGRAERNSLF